MMNINDYISMSAENFMRKLNAGVPLCQCKTLTFKEEQLPDYTNEIVQDFYIMRYGMAYAFEYKKLYKTMMENISSDVLDELTIYNRDFEVVSLGCGNMIDYWALRRVFPEEYTINYHGIDVVDWNNKFPCYPGDSMDFQKCKISEYFSSCDCFSADAYIFPKSISEFDDEEIEAVCESWRDKGIYNDEVHLLFAMRSTDTNLKLDCKKAKKLSSTLASFGMKSNGPVKVEGVGRKVYNLDKDFSENVWKKVYGDLENFPKACKKHNNFCNCSACDFGRTLPIGYDRYMRLKIYTFRRDGWE